MTVSFHGLCNCYMSGCKHALAAPPLAPLLHLTCALCVLCMGQDHASVYICINRYLALPLQLQAPPNNMVRYFWGMHSTYIYISTEARLAGLA